MPMDDSVDSVRELRKRLGMAQEDFAHAIAVSVSTVNRWENGRAEPSRLAVRAMVSLARKNGIHFALNANTPPVGACTPVAQERIRDVAAHFARKGGGQ
ncbi:MAG: helix-turn-helix transcriptional regulator [Parcubacteria group bacterium]|nr:helix-turn-helix transcriptional regulator [Parcubacteria group bacterium]